jgi:hypothetical protein
MLKKFATMQMFFMIFLFSTTNASKIIKIKSMKKINSNKFQYLNVNNFEIILKFLNFDDLSHILRACEKSKSNYLKQTILKLFQTFYKKKIKNSIQYMSSEIFHAKQIPHKNSIKFFEKYLNLKTISLPKFIEHVIEIPKFRIVSHIDGFFSIEQKLEHKYVIVSLQNLFSQQYPTDTYFIKLLDLIFSPKYFITFISTHQNDIFIIFQAAQIFICGKTGHVRWCCQPNNLRKMTYFIPGNKTYFMSYLEPHDKFVVYHISSGEIFIFEISSNLKSIFMNPNSKLDYDFLKNNGKSSGFVDSTNYLFNQMMAKICEITHGTMGKTSNQKLNEILNEIDNI